MILLLVLAGALIGILIYAAMLDRTPAFPDLMELPEGYKGILPPRVEDMRLRKPKLHFNDKVWVTEGTYEGMYGYIRSGWPMGAKESEMYRNPSGGRYLVSFPEQDKKPCTSAWLDLKYLTPIEPGQLPVSPYTGQEYDPAWATVIVKGGWKPPREPRKPSNHNFAKSFACGFLFGLGVTLMVFSLGGSFLPVFISGWISSVAAYSALYWRGELVQLGHNLVKGFQVHLAFHQPMQEDEIDWCMGDLHKSIDPHMSLNQILLNMGQEPIKGGHQSNRTLLRLMKSIEEEIAARNGVSAPSSVYTPLLSSDTTPAPHDEMDTEQENGKLIVPPPTGDSRWLSLDQD